MSVSSDTRQALILLERIQQRLRASQTVQPVSEDLNTLIGLLESPVFRNILTIQDSLHELRRQIHQHPSILPVDFDITNTGQLILNLPPSASTANDDDVAFDDDDVLDVTYESKQTYNELDDDVLTDKRDAAASTTQDSLVAPQVRVKSSAQVVD